MAVAELSKWTDRCLCAFPGAQQHPQPSKPAGSRNTVHPRRQHQRSSEPADTAHENTTHSAVLLLGSTGPQAATRCLQHTETSTTAAEAQASNAQAQDSTPHLRSFCQQHSNYERQSLAVIPDKSMRCPKGYAYSKAIPYGHVFRSANTTPCWPCLNPRPGTTRRRALGNKHHDRGSRSLDNVWQERELLNKLHQLCLQAPQTPLATLCNFKHTTSD
jgi:hypothetical protein